MRKMLNGIQKSVKTELNEMICIADGAAIKVKIIAVLYLLAFPFLSKLIIIWNLGKDMEAFNKLVALLCIGLFFVPARVFDDEFDE